MSNIYQRLAFRIENFIMEHVVPLDKPGRLMKPVFKIPVLYYRLGLGGLIGRQFLLLETTGRKSGKIRLTAIGYGRDPVTRTFVLISGWRGQTDWFRNALACPRVTVQIGKLRFPALATRLTDEEVAAQMAEVFKINPAGMRMFARWTSASLDGSPESLLAAAPDFPGLRLVPVVDEETLNELFDESKPAK